MVILDMVFLIVFEAFWGWFTRGFICGYLAGDFALLGLGVGIAAVAAALIISSVK
jgi:hypothetical protein